MAIRCSKLGIQAAMNRKKFNELISSNKIDGQQTLKKYFDFVKF